MWKRITQLEYGLWLQNPSNRARLYYYRGMALLKTGNYSEAQDVLRILDYNSGNHYDSWLQNPTHAANFNFYFGSTYIYEQEYDNALYHFNCILDRKEYFKKWLQGPARRNMIYYNHAFASYQMDDYKKALSSIEMVDKTYRNTKSLHSTILGAIKREEEL